MTPWEKYCAEVSKADALRKQADRIVEAAGKVLDVDRKNCKHENVTDGFLYTVCNDCLQSD